MSFLLTALHWILPASFWGWVGTSTFVLVGGAVVFYMLGGSRLVSAAASVLAELLKPVATALGKALVTAWGWLWDALGITWRNPEILSLLVTVLLVFGCRYYVPLRVELASTKAQLARCVAAKPAPVVKKTAARVKAKRDTTFLPPDEKGWSLW